MDKIIDFIENNSNQIIENIDFESVEVYCFLKKQYENTNVNENYMFQFIYRSFYRIDSAGLTPEFKTEYFKILEENRNTKPFDFNGIIDKLSSFPNRKGQKTLQFSFITKMQNTIDNSTPIYDSKVAKVFNISRPYQTDFGNKLRAYLKQLDFIKQSYEEINKLKCLPKTTLFFDKKFGNHNLHEMKKLDFIFWSAGKIKDKHLNGEEG